MVRGCSVHMYRYVYHIPELKPLRVLLHYVGLDDDAEPYDADNSTEAVPEDAGFLDSEVWPLHSDHGVNYCKTDTVATLAKEGLSVMGQ